MRAKDVQKALNEIADPSQIERYSRFFKMGPGEYAEHDRFMGISVPNIRKIAKQYRLLPLLEVGTLLRSFVHEERMAALCILVDQYKKNPKPVYQLYMDHTRFVNNWDLVDISCPHIVGPHLFEEGPTPLFQLARSDNLWERRIAIVSSWHFIKKKSFETPLKLVDLLKSDSHDLIHKAVGWMLRELGKRDRSLLEEFLKNQANSLPRTALRYAIEHFTQDQRKIYLINRGGKRVTVGAGEAKSDQSASGPSEEVIVELWPTRED